MSDFEDFWNTVIGNATFLSAGSLTQVQSALQTIYDMSTTNDYAQQIIAGLLQNATASNPIKLNIVATSLGGFSAVSSTFTINIPQSNGVIVPVQTFNVTGQWIVEPLYKTLAHELAHLVLNASDPPGSDLTKNPTQNVQAANGSSDLLGGAELVANNIAFFSNMVQKRRRRLIFLPMLTSRVWVISSQTSPIRSATSSQVASGSAR
jgi:hypothetical protein